MGPRSASVSACVGVGGAVCGALRAARREDLVSVVAKTARVGDGAAEAAPGVCAARHSGRAGRVNKNGGEGRRMGRMDGERWEMRDEMSSRE
jgi:hypothetical protein